MTHIPLSHVTHDEDGLCRVGSVEAPARCPGWRDHEAALVREVDDLAHDFADLFVTAPTLAGVAGAEADLAYALCLQGRSGLATERCASGVAWLRRILHCYRENLVAGAGRIISLDVLGTESHGGAVRPVRIRTERSGALAAKRRVVVAETLFHGDGGVFAALNEVGGGALDLPRVEVRSFDGFPEISWQEWVEAPNSEAETVGIRCAMPRAADDTWRRVGQLAGVSAALGITDLGEDNVVTRERDGMVELVPIDTEMFLHDGLGLHRTHLTRDPELTPNHHTGIEIEPRLCTGGGPITYVDANGGVRMRTASCRRDASRSLIGDGGSRVGYARSLPSFLRGVVDTWTVVAQHRNGVAEILRREKGLRRHLLRPTAEYTDALARWSTGEVDDPVDALDGEVMDQEAEQLRFGDVPYVVRRTTDEEIDAWVERMTLTALGPVLRDAVEFVRSDLLEFTVDDRQQIAVHLPSDGEGVVSARVTGTDRLLVFSWSGDRVGLELAQVAGAPDTECAHPEVRDRLLRLRSVDAGLRTAWTATRFTDEELAGKLRALTDAGAQWLVDVVDEIGWPGPSVVGSDAAAAASELVQHLEAPEQQRGLLHSLVAAALRGVVPWRTVAGAVDAHAVLTGAPQTFGTKFERGPAGFEPYPLIDPDRADHRRAGIGLDTLDEYRRRIERTVHQMEEEAAS